MPIVIHRCVSTPRDAATPPRQVLLRGVQTRAISTRRPTALLALLDADYVHHQLVEGGQTLKTLGDAWETLARKLCGT